MSTALLKSALKRQEADIIASSWMKNKKEIENFLLHFDEHTTIVQRKGMWILGIINEIDSTPLLPFHPILYSIFCTSADSAVRREIFQILLPAKDVKIRGKMLDEAICCIENPASSVAECHHALQWLLEPAKKHPEIALETIAALSATLKNRTAAWTRYAEKQIIRLQKQHKKPVQSSHL